jgi:hypothetical protein
MCYHITGAVKGIGLEALNAALRAAGGGMVFADASASPVQGQLAAGERYLEHASGGWCDCGTMLGQADPPGEADRRAAKLRAKGWGQAKIDRWLAQTRQASQEKLTRRVDQSNDPGNDTWAVGITAALAAGAAGFGLVLHWYSGAVADERFHLSRAAFPLAALDPELLSHMPHDTLYWFTTREVGVPPRSASPGKRALWPACSPS